MTNFLLWNTNKKALDEIIVQLVKEHEVDVLLLIERTQPAAPLLTALKRVAPFHVVASQPRFQLLTRFNPVLMRPLKPVVKNDRSDY